MAHKKQRNLLEAVGILAFNTFATMALLMFVVLSAFFWLTDVEDRLHVCSAVTAPTSVGTTYIK